MRNLINISVSTSKFNHKPLNDDYKNITFTKKMVDSFSFLSLIKQGYLFTHIYTDNHSFSIAEKKKDNFTYSQFIGIDIESDVKEIPTFNDAWSKILLKPTIGYETSSNGIKGNRYRFIYFFSEKITDPQVYEDTYWRIISMLNKSYDFFTQDHCGKEVTRCFFGNPNYCNIQYEDAVYTVDSFKDYEPYKEEKTYIKKELNISFNSTSVSKYETSNSLVILNQTIKDFEELSFEDFTNKYQNDYLWMQSNRDSFEYNEEGYAVTNGELIEINRRFKKDEKGRIVPRLIKDGEQRRRNLLGLAMIQKALHKGNLDLGGILYCLEREMRFIDNTKDEITKDELYKIAEYVDATEPDTISYSSKKIITNPKLSVKEKRKVANIGRGKENRKQIALKVNLQLSFNENLKRIGCSRNTLKRVYEENGLNFNKKQAAKALFVHNITAKQLISSLADNDIKISMKTAYTYIAEFEKEYRLSIRRKKTNKKKVVNVRVIDLCNNTKDNTTFNLRPFPVVLSHSTLSSNIIIRKKSRIVQSEKININENIIAFSPPQQIFNI